MGHDIEKWAFWESSYLYVENERYHVNMGPSVKYSNRAQKKKHYLKVMLDFRYNLMK